jgi:hypothetical protein
MTRSAGAAVCSKPTENCSITVTTSVWTGQPTILCQAGIAVIRLDVSFTCGLDCTAQQTVYRCANSTQGFVVTGSGGCFVKFSVIAGHTWGDAVTDCNAFTVSGNPRPE